MRLIASRTRHTALLLLGLLSTIGFAPLVGAACSDYLGRASINEVHRQGNNTRFIEIKVFDAAVNVSGWTLQACAAAQGNRPDVCGTWGVASMVGDGPWRVLPQDRFAAENINLSAMDLLLTDADGKTIDYFSVGGHDALREELSCDTSELMYDWAHSASNEHTLRRLPDGTGDWESVAGGASGEKSEGTENLAPGAAPQAHHVRLIHPNSGLTCQRSPVTVQLCEDADCTSLYGGTADVTLFPSGAWSAGDTVTVTDGEAQVWLHQRTPATLQLGAVSGAAPYWTECNTGDCSMTIHEAGFAIEIPDNASCSETTGVVRAVRADPANPEQCIGDGGFANRSVDLAVWSTYDTPATGNTAVQVNGSGIADGAPATALPVTFDGAAEAPIRVRYADAGRVMLNAQFTGSGEEDGLLMEGAATFLAVPELVAEAYLKDGTPMTAAGVPQPAERLHRAGVPFDLRVRAQCASGETTPNFQLDDIAIEHTLLAPAGGTAGNLAQTAFDLSAADAGETVVADQALSEVGEHRLRILPPTYLGAVLDSIDLIPAARLVPAHLDVLVVEHGCSNTAGLTYSGQPIGEVLVRARAGGGSLTLNYDGGLGFAREVRLSDAATGDESGLTGNVVGAEHFSGGVASILRDLDAGSGVAYTLSAPETAPYPLTLRAVDQDGVSSQGQAEGTTEVRSARLRIVNAVGSERLPLPLPLRVESWRAIEAGIYAWDTETDDACTTLALEDFEFSDLQYLSAPAIQAVALPSGGSGEVTLAPTFERGSVDVGAALLERYPWLRFDWRGAGVQDPVGRAAFGLFDGNTRNIYQREWY